MIRWVAAVCLGFVAATASAHAPQPVSVVAGSGAGEIEHQCIHDTPEFQEMLRHDADLAEAHAKTAGRVFEAQASAAHVPLDITAATLDLDDSSRYCAGTTGTAPVFRTRTGTIGCSSTSQFTPERKAHLVSTLLPSATRTLKAALKTTPIAAGVKIPTWACRPYTIAEKYRTDGIVGAQYVLFVSAAPTTGAAAWAGSCYTYEVGGRPVAGRANFSPSYLNANGNLNSQLVIANHEIIHALGFTGSNFGPGRRIETKSVTLRGKATKLIAGPKTIDEMRRYANCFSLEGAEIEDEGGSGTIGSHFERRVFRDDMMAGIIGRGMSRVTLAVLEDLGWYTAEYSTVDESIAVYGRNAGCGFHTSKCTTAAGGLGVWFCTGSSPSKACAGDGRSIGSCSSAGGLMNGCQIIRGNQQCNSPTATTPSPGQLQNGFYFGPESWCFDTKGIISSAGSATTSNTFACLKQRCSPSGNVEFQIGTDPWITCQTPGEVKTNFVSWKGHVTCPKTTTVRCPPVVATPAPTPVPPAAATPAPTPAPPAPTPAPFVLPPFSTPGPTAMITRFGFMRITGRSFDALILSQSRQLRAAFVNDLATALNCDGDLIDVTSLSSLTRDGTKSLYLNFTVAGAEAGSALDVFTARLSSNSGSGSLENSAWLGNLTALSATANPTDPPLRVVEATSSIAPGAANATPAPPISTPAPRNSGGDSSNTNGDGSLSSSQRTQSGEGGEQPSSKSGSGGVEGRHGGGEIRDGGDSGGGCSGGCAAGIAIGVVAIVAIAVAAAGVFAMWHRQVGLFSASKTDDDLPKVEVAGEPASAETNTEHSVIPPTASDQKLDGPPKIDAP